MAASSTVVIKVKYGEMLRRFNAQIVDDKLVLNMAGLRKKISSLFSFAPDIELILTYIDEDNDVVALVDDDDLCDVMKQGLNPFRITVKVNDERHSRPYNHSNASSTPLRLPSVQQPLPNLNAGVPEILRKVPDPLSEMLGRLSEILTSKASSPAPGISELVDYFSKVSSSYLGQISETHAGVNSSRRTGVPCKAETELYSQEISATQPGNYCLQNLVPEHSESDASDTVCEKEKDDVVGECSNGKYCLTGDLPPVVVDGNIAGKEVCDPSEPKLGSNCASVGASEPTNGDHVNDRPPSVGKSPPLTWTSHDDGLNFSSFGGSSTMYECPFSGTLLENILASPPQPASGAVPFGRSTSQNDRGGNIFHRGVRCDGCGIHPIVGPRFKSKVKANYDLCCICFDGMGNDNDYIRMDRPAVYRHHVSFKGLRDARAGDHSPMLPHGSRGSKVKLGAAKLDSRFIQDVNIFDGTVMAPSTPFTKIWRMRNSGTVMWPQKTQLAWIGGNKLSNTLSVEVQIPAAGLAIDQELDVAVDFISPELPGQYVSYWRMASPSGQKFGQRVWVLIQVDAPVIETPCESVRNLNLNLPPLPSSLTGPEIIYVDPEPIVEDCRPVVDNSKKIVELGKLDTDQELKFPINDSLLVGDGPSTSVPCSASSSVSYPIIDLYDVAPALPSSSPAVHYTMPPPPSESPAAPPHPPSVSPATHYPVLQSPRPLPATPVPSASRSAVELPGKNQVEEKLLRELEEMGFKQVDLNKEVLRMNEYDLEQAVGDLCGAEWDPILEELQEMGFHDTEMNKKLLKKNNGSIKRVVMDLIAGEKI